MRKILNTGWQFNKMPVGTSYEEAIEELKSFKEVAVPHDFAIEKFENFYADATGWYRKILNLKKDESKRVLLYFDGVYMDCAVYVNSTKVFEWKYGYTQFEVDITEFAVDGDNEICVSVNYMNPNSRWYSGAGITRNVWMDIVPNTYIPRYGVYANAVKVAGKDEWTLTVDTHVCNYEEGKISDSLSDKNANLIFALTDEFGKEVSLHKMSTSEISKDYEGFVIRNIFSVEAPAVWDIDSPSVYTLKVTLNGASTEKTIIGFRTIDFKPDTGFWLNGRNIKINGVCEHHDFGMIGGVFYEDAMERKIITLKNMGVNSIRFSHNPVDEKAIELCDRLGILVLSEAFDMWINPKTTYDYARFFKEWYKKDVRAWVTKDRNHPSLILWSIGNEIYDIHLGQEGRDTVNELSKTVRQFDPFHNAYVTFCSNYMPWENAQKAANDVEVVGYNYAEKFYEEHHKKNPQWVIYGSETSSIVYSRGVYRFPYDISCMTDDDSQCSCMGNSTTSWGAESFEKCACDDRDMEFSAGQYLWTGFDYLGEPTPYHTKNSYFGQIDTAGYPKDVYYMWQSVWTDYKKSPMVYISPYWDFNDKQCVDIRVMTNAPIAEIFVNGICKGKYEFTHASKSGRDLVATVTVPFEKGTIKAVAYDENGNAIASCERSSYGDTKKIICKEQEYNLYGDKYELGRFSTYGDKLKFYDIYAVDENGNVVENASDLVDVTVTGDGEFVVLDNGDSTDYTPQKSQSKRLFYGKLLMLVKKTGDGAINVTVKSNKETIPVRRIDLKCEGSVELTENNSSSIVKVNILPENATDTDIEFKITDMIGNDSPIALVDTSDFSSTGTVMVKAVYDGTCKLRAFSKSGTSDVRVISELIFNINGLKTAMLDPYKFIPGSVYSYGVGNLTNGNERGVATSRNEETVVVYENVDFGARGSDNITIPIFALDGSKIIIEIYDGKWGSSECELICEGAYQHEMIWNVYQEDTYFFNKRLKGIHTLCFRTRAKIHIKGFSCKEYNPAYETLNASEAVKIYGDTFTVKKDIVEGIGNNVTIDFGEMDFGESGAKKITICGRANNNRNTVHVRFVSDNNEERCIVEYDPSSELVTKSFDVSGIKGKGKVELVFLPGCNFDLKWIRFE